jgi:hypothetical protein
MAEPECTCDFGEDGQADDPWNPECFYHGDNGTMVSIINLSKLLRHAPRVPITGGLLRQSCPHCGREI